MEELRKAGQVKGGNIFMKGSGVEEIKSPFSSFFEKGLFNGIQENGYLAEWAAATNPPAKAAFSTGLGTIARFFRSDSQKQK